MAQLKRRHDPGVRARCACALLLIASALPLASGCSKKPTDVVLITVDTLRADHVGAYGGPPANTPHIDRLAWEGTLYERASAPMPLTRPTHASLLTGRYPREHGVVNNALSLPEHSGTLAEILRGAGYRTGAFVSVALLSGQAGFAQGFEVFDLPAGARLRSAEDAVTAALRWLSGLGDREPYFLWIHLFDPHLPYAPPAAYRRNLDAALSRELPSVSWSSLQSVAREHGGDIPAAVLAYARSLYRGEVSYTDEWVGRLVSGIEAKHPLDQTLIVFTADHGECFERGVYFEHADCLGEGALHVPLIVRFPPAFARGARVAAQVSSIDVAPTILSALGLPIPSGQSGTPLQKLDHGAERYVLVEYPLYQERSAEQRTARRSVIRSVAGDPVQEPLIGSQRVGVVGGAWKFLRGEPRDEQLFALGAGGEVPAPESETDVRARLAGELDRQLAAHPLTVLDPGQINDELRESLRALGYLEESGR